MVASCCLLHTKDEYKRSMLGTYWRVEEMPTETVRLRMALQILNNILKKKQLQISVQHKHCWQQWPGSTPYTTEYRGIYSNSCPYLLIANLLSKELKNWVQTAERILLRYRAALAFHAM